MRLTFWCLVVVLTLFKDLAEGLRNSFLYCLHLSQKSPLICCVTLNQDYKFSFPNSYFTLACSVSHMPTNHPAFPLSIWVPTKTAEERSLVEGGGEEEKSDSSYLQLLGKQKEDSSRPSFYSQQPTRPHFPACNNIWLPPVAHKIYTSRSKIVLTMQKHCCCVENI